MKVIVSVLGRFHAFYLASELESRGHLERLYTSYPASWPERFGVPAARVTGRPLFEALNRAAQRVQPMSGGRMDPRDRPCRLFDRFVASRLTEGPDVFVGWSGSSLQALRRAKELGMLAVVERGSTHIHHQEEVLRREYDRWGIHGRRPHPVTLETELLEYQTADRIAVPTRAVAETFLTRGIPEDRIIQVPYGVSLESFRPPTERKGPFRVIHCGNVSIRKGCHYLLEAFCELDLPDAELWFVGPVADDMRTFLERKKGARVVLKGAVPQEELSGLYGQASVFCLASLEEGLAMVVPQAMACGLPVIVTRESGAGEIVREGIDGIIVKSRDKDGLKEALLELWSDSEQRLEMGRRALQRVSAGFAWSDYGARITAAYERALRENRAKAANGFERSMGA